MISLGTDDTMNSITSDTIINYSEFSDHPIPHINQDTNWDCGLACVVMTLRGLGFIVSVEEITRQCPVNSVWTIDLAFLLRNYVQDFTYYTSYLGSRKEYQDQKFYQDSFNEDEKRVNKLFAIAKSCSVHVVRMMLPLDDFKRFLFCKKFAIITLVNARLLRCQLCKQHRGCLGSLCSQLDLLLERCKGYDYLGHFIVLIGYDPTEDLFVYRDPAANDAFCTISADDLDEARQSEGTDHDCIVVKLA
ncbi:Guanylyl cyclase [Gilbertella persicaria]|uniref:Guanylyl cyclase n=1 Tax=Gilbertella persicaria TaxID=101096 RepID=UPI00221EF7B6|nr:Guanylyl cyclase [Gilbertella persicaria]KAI8078155.1 Guanylyl cyclase [Gilbertella persicaria]